MGRGGVWKEDLVGFSSTSILAGINSSVFVMFEVHPSPWLQL